MRLRDKTRNIEESGENDECARRKAREKTSNRRARKITRGERFMPNGMLVVTEVPRLGWTFRDAWMGFTTFNS